jgi:hypothetical protein
MIEGGGSGTIPLTNGSAGRPKNMWIRWIRIRNTVEKVTVLLYFICVQEEMERVDEEDWLLQDVIFVEDSRNIPVGKVLKVRLRLIFLI